MMVHQWTAVKKEIFLKPVKVVKDPLGKIVIVHTVLCETLNPDGTPNEYNTRSKTSTFEKRPEDKPMFGLEQEFFLSSFDNEGNILIGFTIDLPAKEQGDYYVGFTNVFGEK